jgi:hypothetical protein
MKRPAQKINLFHPQERVNVNTLFPRSPRKMGSNYSAIEDGPEQYQNCIISEIRGCWFKMRPLRILNQQFRLIY